MRRNRTVHLRARKTTPVLAARAKPTDRTLNECMRTAATKWDNVCPGCSRLHVLTSASEYRTIISCTQDEESAIRCGADACGMGTTEYLIRLALLEQGKCVWCGRGD